MPHFPSHRIQYHQEDVLDKARGYKTSVSQIAEPDHQSMVKEWGDVDTFYYKYGFYQDTAPHKLIREPESQIISLRLPQPTQPGSNDLQIFEQQSSHYIENDADNGKNEISLSLPSLDLLKHDPTEFKSCTREQASAREDKTEVGNKKLSTHQIMTLAGERFIEFSSYMFINLNANLHPYDSNLADLAVDDKFDVKLVQLLLTVAEKVSQKETDRSYRLLSNCRRLASNIGTPVQRAVFYFAEALAKKIKREKGEIVSTISEEKNPEDPSISSKLKHQSAILAWYKKLPFSQVMQFAGVQAMLTNIKMNSKIHVIDIQMRTGITWAVVMQALVKQECYNVKQLKLTVIETIDKEAVEVACTHLQNFAKTLNLMFSYHIIFLSDMTDLSDKQFEVEEDEVILAYAPFVLRTMISRPLCLERLMDTMKQLNPSVMVITEVEANHNSPSFVNRFIEAFFYFGALFDNLEDCMAQNDQERVSLEAGILSHGIHNIVATEGTERVTRSVKFEVWRAFFERFGMVEAELSESSLYQAYLVLQEFPCVNSCSLGFFPMLSSSPLLLCYY